MIINSSKVKSEALLLFCRELINSYEKSDDTLFDISKETKNFINEQTKHLLKAINVTVQPKEYYTRNIRVTRIAIIIKSYEYINTILSKKLQKGEKFNPAMLCFALLCSWFAEMSIKEDDKEFLYFSFYPYSEIYDKMLLNIEDLEYKKLNISMLQIAEETIYKLHTYRFK